MLLTQKEKECFIAFLNKRIASRVPETELTKKGFPEIEKTLLENPDSNDEILRENFEKLKFLTKNEEIENNILINTEKSLSSSSNNELILNDDEKVFFRRYLFITIVNQYKYTDTNENKLTEEEIQLLASIDKKIVETYDESNRWDFVESEKTLAIDFLSHCMPENDKFLAISETYTKLYYQIKSLIEQA